MREHEYLLIWQTDGDGCELAVCAVNNDRVSADEDARSCREIREPFGVNQPLQNFPLNLFVAELELNPGRAGC